jgi:hypothetical protein
MSWPKNGGYSHVESVSSEEKPMAQDQNWDQKSDNKKLDFLKLLTEDFQDQTPRL